MKLPQLNLRDLFWLILAIALAVGWATNRQRLQHENARLKRQDQATTERARVATHEWWIESIKELDDEDRLMLLVKLAAEQPRPNYELIAE